MVTGVWSKRITEAHERNGGDPRPMAFAAIVLFGVTALGFRLKMQLLRETLFHLQDAMRGNYSTGARHAGASGDAYRRQRRSSGPSWQQQRQQQYEHQQQRFEEWARQHARSRAGGSAPRVDLDAELQRHRQLLGVHAACSRAELKAAYYKKAKLSHPDSSSSSSASGDDFARLKQAYDALLPRVRS